MAEDERERCGNCRFWRATIEFVCGECRRFPPPALRPLDQDDEAEGNFSNGVALVVQENQWCGEHRWNGEL